MKRAFRLAFRIWFIAQVCYCILNVPGLLVPAIFAISVGLALLCGIPAYFLLVLLLWVLAENVKKPRLLVVCTFVFGLVFAFGATLIASRIMDGGKGAWNAWQDYMIFPIAGLVSAAVGVLLNSRRIAGLATGRTTNNSLLIHNKSENE